MYLFVLIQPVALVSNLKVEDISFDRGKAHASEDAEALLFRYQGVQRSMEKNSANLTDEWYIDPHMSAELEKAE